MTKKLISVAELRQIATLHQDEMIDILNTAVRAAAAAGRKTAKIDIKPKYDVDFMINTLKSAGYTAKRESGSDWRDSESWDYISVSWKF